MKRLLEFRHLPMDDLDDICIVKIIFVDCFTSVSRQIENKWKEWQMWPWPLRYNPARKCTRSDIDVTHVCVRKMQISRKIRLTFLPLKYLSEELMALIDWTKFASHQEEQKTKLLILCPNKLNWINSRSTRHLNAFCDSLKAVLVSNLGIYLSY